MKELNFKDIVLSSTCFEELSNFFETQKLEQLGREVKFIERSTSRWSASKSVGQSKSYPKLSFLKQDIELLNILKDCTKNNLPHTF